MSSDGRSAGPMLVVITHYEALGVSRDVSPRSLRAAYRRAALHSHPDRQVHVRRKELELLDSDGVSSGSSDALCLDRVGAESTTVHPCCTPSLAECPDGLTVAIEEEAKETEAEKRFHRIQLAYETLRDAASRTRYDAELLELRRQTELPVHVAQEVDLDDMQYVEIDGDDGHSYFELACRCGDSFRVSEKELDDGVDVLGCRACSLHVRLLYCVASDHSEDES